MKFITFLYLVTTLFRNIHCNGEGHNPFAETITKIEGYAATSKPMDKVLHPWKKEQGGYLGKGKSGFGYKFDVAGETLALKFVPISDRFKVDREYKNYAGLEAILTNSTAHPYGIPSVHFRGDIKIGSRIFDTIGLKFLEGDFNSKMEEEYIKCLGSDGKPARKLSDAFVSDFLNGYQQALVPILRAHALGVLHNDIKPDCFRLGDDGRLYLIDWNAGQRKDVKEYIKDHTRKYASRRGLAEESRNEHDDIEALHNVFMKYGGAIFPWSTGITIADAIIMRNDRDEMIAICETLNHPTLVQFCKENYEEIYHGPDSRFPRYVFLHDLAENLKKQISHLEFFSWFTEDDKAQARKNPLPAIKKMALPTGTYNLKKPTKTFPDPRNDPENAGCCVVN